MSFEDDIHTEMGDILSAEFTRSVIIQIGAASATLDCIFNKTHAEVDAQEVLVQSNIPTFGIDKTAADTALGTELVESSKAVKSYATINSIQYTINKVEEDGTGYAQVFLQLPI